MKVIAFQVEVKGQKVMIDNQDKLNRTLKITNKLLGSKEFSGEAYDKLSRTQASLKNAQEKVTQGAKKYRDELKLTEVQGKDTGDALKLQLKLLEAQYYQLAKAERNAADAQPLKNKIKSIRQEIKDLNADIGKRGFADQLKSSLSFENVISGNVSGILAGITAAGPIGAAIGAGLDVGKQVAGQVTAAIQEVNKAKFALQGLVKDSQFDQASAKVLALSRTWGKSIEEITQAANNFSKATGTDFLASLDLIGKGFEGGADKGGEYVKKLTEYSVQLNNFGLQNDEIIKVLIQEPRDGFYTDKFVDSLKEADLALKEFTPTQQGTLSKIFGQGFTNDLFKGISSGELSTLEALRKINDRSKELGINLSDLQRITADVFKGAGEDAGGAQRIFDSLFKSLNTGLNEYIATADEFTAKQRRLQQLNEDLAREQVELAKALGSVDGKFESVGIRIKTGLFEALNGLAGPAKKFGESLQPAFRNIDRLLESLGVLTAGESRVKKYFETVGKFINLQFTPLKALIQGLGQVANFFEKGLVASGIRKSPAEREAEAYEKAVAAQEELKKKALANLLSGNLGQAADSNITGNATALLKAVDVQSIIAKESLAGLNLQLEKLRQRLNESADPDQTLIAKIVGTEQQIAEKQKAFDRLQAIARGTFISGANDLLLDQGTGSLTSNQAERQLAIIDLIAQKQRQAIAESQLAETDRVNTIRDLELATQEQTIRIKLRNSQTEYAERVNLERQLAEVQAQRAKNSEADQVRTATGQIDALKQIRAQEAEQTIRDKQELEDTLRLIELRAVEETLKLKLQSRQLESQERINLERQLADTQRQIETGTDSRDTNRRIAGINIGRGNEIIGLKAEQLTVAPDSKRAKEIADQIVQINLAADSEILRAKLQNKNIEVQERLALESELLDKELQLTQIQQTKLQQLRKATIDQVSGAFLNGIEGLVGQAADNAERAEEQRSDRAIERLEQEYERRLELAGDDKEQQEALRSQLEQRKTAIEQEAARKRQNIRIKEALADAALAAIKTTASLGFPLAIPALAALAVQTLFSIAQIKAQQFAAGGRVKYYDELNGLIDVQPNISTTPRGDNVLATLKVGEVVLNEEQQRRLQAITGRPSIFRDINVPGFDGGGRVEALYRATGVPSAKDRMEVSVNVELSPEQIENAAELAANKIAEKAGLAIQAASEEAARQERNRKMLQRDIAD